MSEKNKTDNIRIIAECAIMIAVGTILAQIKIFRMPNGGSVTAASMVPFLMISYRHGTKWGILAGFVNALFQMLLGGIYPPVAPGFLSYVLEIMLDYLLAYMVLGFSGAIFRLFSKKSRFIGILLSGLFCCILRFLCAFISGFVVWADLTQQLWGAISYSFVYNASYLFPETFVNVLVLCVLYKLSPRLFYKPADNML